MPMDKEQALKRLANAIAAIPELSPRGRRSPEFKEWRRDTRVMLGHVFEMESDHVKEFNAVRYSLSRYSNRTTDSQFEAAFQRGLQSAKALLKSMINEITEYGPDESVPTEPAKAIRSARQGRPRVFIGSSTEGLPIAEAIHSVLDHDAEVTPWTYGVFELSSNAIDDLIRQAQESDYAVLVLTADDITLKRDKINATPRDNVVFELGLFMGALGRLKTFVVHKRGESIDLPTDLAGLTTATFADRSDNNLKAAVGPLCTQIKDAFKRDIVMAASA